MRIRIVKSTGKYKAGEVTEVGNADAQDLLRSGVAQLSTDLVQTDYKTKGRSNGKSSRLRTNKRR